MIQNITFTTSDNVKLVGKQFNAENPLCYLVFFLGLGGSSDSRSVNIFFEKCALNGITSIVFTPRGHKNSEGAFTVDNYARDIKEITAKYAPLAKLHKRPYLVGAHSIGTVALLRTQPIADEVILFNPVVHTRFFNPFMRFVAKYSRKLAVFVWNVSKGKFEFQFDHIDWCYITDKNFSELRKDMFNITRNRSLINNHCDCTLVLTTGDTYQKYNNPIMQQKAFDTVAPLFEEVKVKVLSKLSHFVSDDKKKPFMHTIKVQSVINIILDVAKNTPSKGL